MRITAYGITDLGMVRKNNEDQFVIADLTKAEEAAIGIEKGFLLEGKESLLAVSDGMGGALAGEIASGMAVKTLLAELAQSIDHESPDVRLLKAAQQANRNIFNRSQSDNACAGMGATLTAALVVDAVAYVAQVGDSRAYLIREGIISRVTKDQTLIQAMLDTGNYKPEELAHSPYRNVILQALGANKEVKAVITRLPLLKGDLMLLCSDGLSNKVDEKTMLSIIIPAKTLKAACREMIALANKNGGDDNITLVLASYGAEKEIEN